MNIFYPKGSQELDDFVKNIEWGYIRAHRNVFYCKAIFDDDGYDDAYYDHFGISQPQHIKRSVTKRRAEHLAGRLCCQRILRALGLPEEVSCHADRSPCWPPSVTGSISHCKNQALALVTREQNVCLGVDIELLNSQILRESADIFSSSDERNSLTEKFTSDAHALLLIFSAKESLFKALYPRVNYFFGFEYARLWEVDIVNQQFKIELVETLVPSCLEKGMCWVGFFSFDNDLITTVLVC